MDVKTYAVEVSPRARKKLDKLDAPVRKRIEAWIDNRLVGCEDPRRYGKPLEGQLDGLWRYRVGDWRLVAEIRDNKLIILVINVDKRNDIYK